MKTKMLTTIAITLCAGVCFSVNGQTTTPADSGAQVKSEKYGSQASEQGAPKDFGDRISRWRSCDAKEPARARRCGLAGGMVPGIVALDVKPVRDLMNQMSDLQGISFSRMEESRFQPVFVCGGMGYLGFNNGVRLGGGGMQGRRYFKSDPYTSDSVVGLTINVQYGGFLIDKAFDFSAFSILAGMQVGGGSLTASFRRTDGNLISAFDRDDDSEYESHYNAPFIMFEMHSGINYSLVSFLHVGADVSLPLFFSAQGFEASTDSFVTANPAVSLRIIFGSL